MENTLREQEEKIKKLIDDGDYDAVRSWFTSTDPADVADILEELDPEDVNKVFTKVDDTEAVSDVIVEMEPNELDDVVELIPTDQKAAMIEEMAPDDAADFFAELEDRDREKVYKLLDSETKKTLSELLDYEEDSAGGLMTSELCAVPISFTVEETLKSLIDCEFSDPITMIFAVDKERHLKGGVLISELISKNSKLLIKDIIDEDIVYANVDEDQQQIALKFRKYDLYVMPVLDDDRHLVGRITADDVMDVMDEEAVQDIAHMAGAPDIERHEDSPLQIVRLRLPWLLITMATGLLVSLVVKMISTVSVAAFGLAAFVPLILSMGGNTGMQATAVTIRSIALGEIEFGKLFSLFMREIGVGAVMGAICGLITAVIVWIYLKFFGHSAVDIGQIIRFSSIVAVSMLTAMTFAAFSGTLIPIMLEKVKIDPAVASGPFVTTFNDLSASCIYLVMCYLLLPVSVAV